jgi:hypothetical protein
MPAKSAGKQSATFRQVCELSPPHMVAKLARKHGVKSRVPFRAALDLGL